MFRRTMSRAGWCVLAATAVASPVAAEEAPADARDSFARGRERRQEGDCAGALPLFRRARELYPAGLGSLRNIAECEEALGHFASARRAWLDLGRDLITHDDPKYDGWQEDAAQAAARLAPKVSTLRVDVDVVTPAGQSLPEAPFEVRVNGEALNRALVGTPLERDPGHYAVRVAGLGAGALVEEREVDLASGDSRGVKVRLVAAAPESPVLRRSTTARTAAWVAAGIGAASLIGAGIAAVERQSALDELERACGGSPSPCKPSSGAMPPSIAAIDDRGHSASTWVNVLAVAGAVGLSGGLVLYALSRPHSSKAALVLSPPGISVVGSL